VWVAHELLPVRLVIDPEADDPISLIVALEKLIDAPVEVYSLESAARWGLDPLKIGARRL
jgi:hypothetical protein